jgi:hypothetical protein
LLLDQADELDARDRPAMLGRLRHAIEFRVELDIILDLRIPAIVSAGIGAS